MKDWAEAPLGELTVKIGSGATPRGGAAVHTADGVSLIRSQNVLDNVMRVNGIAHISDESADELAGVTVQPSDVLINITGDSIARCTLVDSRVLPARVNQHVAILRTNSRLDPRFLQRYLVNDPIKDHLLAISAGGTRNALTKAQLSALRVRFPSLSEQRAIAEVLGALDDKIAANVRLCASIRLHLLLHYRRAISEAPVLRSLASVAEFHNHRRVPLSARDRDARPGSVPYYGASGAFGYVDSAVFDERLVLVGEDGSVVTEDGHPIVQYIWGPSWVNNHAHVLTGVGVSTELLSVALRDADIRHLVTGAVQPKLSMGKLKSFKVSLPFGNALTRLEHLCDCEMALIRSLTDESRTLAKLRDTLLPRLMSGRVRVRDAEKQVGEVV